MAFLGEQMFKLTCDHVPTGMCSKCVADTLAISVARAERGRGKLPDGYRVLALTERELVLTIAQIEAATSLLKDQAKKVALPADVKKAQDEIMLELETIAKKGRAEMSSRMYLTRVPSE